MAQVLGGAIEAGTSAVGVMTGTSSSSGSSKSRMEEEREERVRDTDEKARNPR